MKFKDGALLLGVAWLMVSFTAGNVVAQGRKSGARGPAHYTVASEITVKLRTPHLA